MSFMDIIYPRIRGKNLQVNFKLYILSKISLDYSKGFGGKFGVQKDRQDEVRLIQVFEFHN